MYLPGSLSTQITYRCCRTISPTVYHRAWISSVSFQQNFFAKKFSKVGKHDLTLMPLIRAVPSMKRYNSSASSRFSLGAFKELDKRVWPISLSTFLMGSAIGIIIPLMPIYVSHLGLSPASVGALIAVLGLTRLIVNLPLASLCDLVGRRPFLVYGPFFNGISLFCTGLSSTFSALFSWRIVNGVSSAAQMTGAQLYLTDISTPQNRGLTLAPTSAAWSAGAAVGPAVGGLIAERFGLNTPFYLVGVAVIAVSYVNYVSLPETKTNLPDKLKFSEESKKIGKYTLSALKQWGELLKDRDIRSIVFLHTTFWFVQSGAQLTLLPLMALGFGVSPSGIGRIYALVAAINVFLVIPAGRLTDIYGRKKVILPGCFLISLTVALLSLAETETHLILLATLWGISAPFLSIAPLAFLTDKTTPETRSQALALFRSGGDFGLLLGAVTSGFIATSVNMSFAVMVNAAILIGASIYFGLRSVETKRENVK